MIASICLASLAAVAMARASGMVAKLNVLIASTRGRCATQLITTSEIHDHGDSILLDLGFSIEALVQARKANELKERHLVFTDGFVATKEIMQSCAMKAALSHKAGTFKVQFNTAKLECALLIASLRAVIKTALKDVTSPDLSSNMGEVVTTMAEFEKFVLSLDIQHRKWTASAPVFDKYSRLISSQLPQLIFTDLYGIHVYSKTWVSDQNRRSRQTRTLHSILAGITKLELLTVEMISSVLHRNRVLSGSEHLPIHSLSLLMSFLVELATCVTSCLSERTKQLLSPAWNGYLALWRDFVLLKQDLSIAQLDSQKWLHLYKKLKHLQVTKTKFMVSLVKVFQ